MNNVYWKTFYVKPSPLTLNLRMLEFAICKLINFEFYKSSCCSGEWRGWLSPHYSLSGQPFFVFQSLFFIIVSVIFYILLKESIFKIMKNLLNLKSFFSTQDIQIIMIFSFPFHSIRIQRVKWNWNNYGITNWLA